MEKISVIIVNWNVNGPLSRCIKSVKETNYPNLEIIVIDNNSDVGPKEVTIQNKENIGFPAAVNQGLKGSTGDFILILNPDTRLPKDFFINALDFASLHPDMGIMGPKFIDPNGTPQGSVFDEPKIGKNRGKYSPRSIAVVDAVSGACLFFHRSTLNKVGHLTEKVFMYYEDLDYCRRIRQAGLKVYYNPNITIVHEHGQSSKQSSQAQKYLWQSSLWYNGPLKHYAMWFYSWTTQKLQKLLGDNK